MKFYDISSTFLAEIYRQSLVRRPVFSLVSLLVRPWPRRVTASAGEPFGAHVCPIPCSLCHLMYTHTLMVLQQMLQRSQHQSTARILVPSGPLGLAEQGLPFWTLLLPLPKFSGRVRTLGIYSILITNQQQLFVKDTIKYYSIPSVPSRLFRGS